MNKLINNIIFDTLSSRRSIRINEIATIAVSLKGSRKEKIESEIDFPKYYVHISNREDCVDLIYEISKFIPDGEQDALSLLERWISEYTVVRGKVKYIKIPNCLTLKIEKNKITIIDVSIPLNMQLNPFNPVARKKSKIGLGVIASVVVIITVFMIVNYKYDFIRIGKEEPTQAKRQMAIVDVQPEVVINEEAKIEKDINREIVPPQRDSIKIDKPVVKKKKIIPQVGIVGNHYIVVGSFIGKTMATVHLNDLEKKYSGVDINILRKPGGGYICYIYMIDDLLDATNRCIVEQNKYPEIRDMWIYTMK